ncbi:MAG: RNA polymerase sigma factor [Draconibacterium sp.]
MEVNKGISDEELVERLQKGDMEAFDQIFKKYGNRLFRFAFNYLKSKEDTEGLVQDTFLKIWINRKSLNKESSLKSYLFTIAYHDMCRLFRKKKLHNTYLKKSQKESNDLFSLEDQLEYKATIEEVDKLIDQLPEKQRIIFLKSRKEGKSTKQIAEEMNLAPGTVDNQISLALKFLRKNISENNFALLFFFALFMQ